MTQIRFCRRAFALSAALLAGAVLAPLAAPAAPAPSQDMMVLAQSSGCTLCHALDTPRAVGVQVPPVGPSWRDISRRYRERPGAVDDLTRTILMGSGTANGASHWNGRASGAEMPANRVEIDAADARALAAWILSLAR
jgi:cytochrome c551/c552